MDTPPSNTLSPDTEVDSGADSGNLDSGFFCELMGVTTQFPHKSDSLQSDPHSSNLISFPSHSDSEIVDNEVVEEQRTQIPLHKQGKIQIMLIAGLVSVPMAVLTYMTFGSSGGEQAIIAKTPDPATLTPKAEFAADPRFPVVQSKLAMQQQEQQLLAAAKSAEQVADSRIESKTTPTTNKGATTASEPPVKAIVTEPAPEPIVNNSPPTNVQPPIVPAPTVAEPVPIKPYNPPVRVVERVVPRTDNPPVRVATRVVPRTDNPPVRVATRVVPKTDNPPVRVATRVVPKTDNPPVRVATRVRDRAIQPSLVASRSLNNRETIKSTPVKTAPKLKSLTWEQASAAGVTVFGSRGERQATVTTQPMSAQIAAKVIIPGQNRTVTLITPLQILGGESSQEILLRLEQAFIDTQGGVIIPPHTIISAQLLVADNGMLRIGSAKAMIGSAEYPIAAGSLMLAATNNTPLIAELKRFGDGEIGRRDLGTFFMGALQGVGKVLTAPNTQTQITTGGAAISTTDNSQNVVGGILEGGASPLVQAWVERNQAEVKRLEGATRLWFLPAGSRMNLFATKPFSLK
jgi:hypothetical protein